MYIYMYTYTGTPINMATPQFFGGAFMHQDTKNSLHSDVFGAKKKAHLEGPGMQTITLCMYIKFMHPGNKNSLHSDVFLARKKNYI